MNFDRRHVLFFQRRIIAIVQDATPGNSNAIKRWSIARIRQQPAFIMIYCITKKKKPFTYEKGKFRHKKIAFFLVIYCFDWIFDNRIGPAFSGKQW